MSIVRRNGPFIGLPHPWILLLGTDEADSEFSDAVDQKINGTVLVAPVIELPDEWREIATTVADVIVLEITDQKSAIEFGRLVELDNLVTVCVERDVRLHVEEIAKRHGRLVLKSKWDILDLLQD